MASSVLPSYLQAIVPHPKATLNIPALFKTYSLLLAPNYHLNYLWHLESTRRKYSSGGFKPSFKVLLASRFCGQSCHWVYLLSLFTESPLDVAHVTSVLCSSSRCATLASNFYSVSLCIISLSYHHHLSALSHLFDIASRFARCDYSVSNTPFVYMVLGGVVSAAPFLPTCRPIILPHLVCTHTVLQVFEANLLCEKSYRYNRDNTLILNILPPIYDYYYTFQ